jgi:short subunit dehydrogenase-like uncharacterized protein
VAGLALARPGVADDAHAPHDHLGQGQEQNVETEAVLEHDRRFGLEGAVDRDAAEEADLVGDVCTRRQSLWWRLLLPCRDAADGGCFHEFNLRPASWPGIRSIHWFVCGFLRWCLRDPAEWRLLHRVADRDLSVVVFGATGVTGRRVAAYLAERAAEAGFSWAVAGRDRAKIERVLGEIGVAVPETIVADVGDPASLAAMASRTRVVLDLVGPYTLYGEPVIEACVANGAHYADLTGEIPFARRIIDAFHEPAVAAGVKIVEVCGFEAMPPDLAVLLAAETARERWSEDLAEADLDIATQQPAGRLGLADLVSGGTMQSMAEALASEGATEVADPAALIPDPDVAAAVRQRSPIAIAPRVNGRGAAIAPMTPAAFINPAVIHRTTALLAAERGDGTQPLRYREGIAIPGGSATLPLRYAAAGTLAATQAGFRSLTRARPSIRRRSADFMRRTFPSSGFGPTGSRLDEWSWHLTLDASTAGGRYVRVDLDADGHPGYLTTAKLLGEAGLLLGEDGATPDRAGCLTPATALGTGSLDRFERAGARFSVSS